MNTLRREVSLFLSNVVFVSAICLLVESNQENIFQPDAETKGVREKRAGRKEHALRDAEKNLKTLRLLHLRGSALKNLLKMIHDWGKIFS